MLVEVVCEEKAQKAWFESVGDSSTLSMATPSFARPQLVDLDFTTGEQFRIAVANMSDVDDLKYFKVVASLQKVDVKNAPIYYEGCGAPFNGRICMKMLNADGTCPRCSTETDAVPVLSLSGVGFAATDGATFRLSAFDTIASILIGFDAGRAKELEEESVRTFDSGRQITHNLLKERFGVPFELAIKASRVVMPDGTPRVSCTIYDITSPTNSKEFV